MVKRAKTTEPENHIAVFQEATIRRTWHNEEWWFSVVDVCAILTGSPDAGAYWRKLKQRLNAEGNQPVTFCHGLKLKAPDGKLREINCANTEGQRNVKIKTLTDFRACTTFAARTGAKVACPRPANGFTGLASRPTCPPVD
nr:hypothetical protein [Rhodoferax sp.]